MTEYVPLIETTDDEPDEKPKVDTTKPDVNFSADEKLQEKLKTLLADADKETAADEPSDSKKLDLLGGLAVVHAENQVELYRGMRTVHIEMHQVRDEVGSLINDIGTMREELDRDIKEIIEEIDAIRDAEDEAAKVAATDDDEIDPSDTISGRAWGFFIRCLAVGVLLLSIAYAITIVFPEGV